LIECWRTDERIIAGAEGESWVANIVIVVSNPGLYGVAQYVHPLMGSRSLAKLGRGARP
jgi:hypothetical protein